MAWFGTSVTDQAYHNRQTDTSHYFRESLCYYLPIAGAGHSCSVTLCLERALAHREQAALGQGVTFDEDRSTVRCGRIPQVMAALRNTAIGLLRLLGATNIAKACRYFAARPHLALAAIGCPSENE